MKKFSKAASVLAVLPLAVAGLVVSTGSASAATVVPPGGKGSACSGYKYADSTHTRKWQTCAWADKDNVWFTVNFSNTSPFDWTPKLVQEDFYKSTVFHSCGHGAQPDFNVPKGSTRGTPWSACFVARSPGAYASVGTVFYTSDSAGVKQTSPTLQVQ